MPISLRRMLLLSLVLHLFLIFLPWRRNTYTPLAKTNLQIEFISRGSPAAESRKHARAHRAARAKSPGGIPLRKLRPGAGWLEHGGAKAFTDYGETGLSEEEWGSHGGRLNELIHFNQYERLFVDIQGLLSYPDRLGLHGLSDTVNTRLVFDEQSRCDWQRTKVGGSHPYFRVYTLALLKKLCALENTARLRFKKGEFADLSFAFIIIDQPETKSEAPLGDFIQGNVLNYRRVFFKPPLRYHVGPLEGYFFAPVVNINFPWIFEHWEKWVEGKDPLREFKSE